MVGSMRSKWRLAAIVAAAILAVVIGFALSMPRYYAEALIVIHPEHDNLTQPSTAQVELPPDSSAIDTEVEILRSPAIAQAVIRKLQLYKSDEFGGSPSATPTDTVMRKVVQSFMANTRIRRIGLTYAVQVGFVAQSSDEAKRIANAIVQAYMSRKMDEKLAAIMRANHDLGAALTGLRTEALTAESRLDDYMAKNGLLSPDGSTGTEAELTALNQRIADAQADSAEKQARVSAAIDQARNGNGGSDVGATLASQTIGALRQKEADVSATLAQLQTQFRPDYPLVQKTEAELKDIRGQLKSETNRIVSSLRADADAAQRREASLLASRQQVETMIANNNRARVGLLALKQSADSAKTIYETYLKRASEVTAERGLQQVDATVESHAVPRASSPFSSFRFIAMGAAVLAFLGSVLAVLLSDLWTPRIRSVGEVARETRLPLAGIVPDVEALKYAEKAANQVADSPMTAIAEAYRSLGAYLAVSAKPGRSKILAIASAVPGEGKTFVTICLARTLAASGAKVVLLDCDFRRANASNYFDKAEAGIAEVIENSVPLERALVKDGKSGFWFLSGSASGADVTADLLGNRLDALFQRLSEKFDYVVIDTPPLLGSADARILASKADRVLYLIEWNKTPASVVRAAMDILRQSNANVAGVVLNKVNVRQQAFYGFADGSDYYYRYGSTYPQLA